MKYVTEARVALLASSLTPREQAVIEALDRIRLATTSQLIRLCFSDTTVRHARRALARLTERRILVTLDRRVGGAPGGSTQAVFGLDLAGQKLASACGPAGGCRIRRPWTPSQLFLAHSLAITELYVALTEQAREGGAEVVAFDGEPLCWRRFTGAAGLRATLKPDAFVRLADEDYEDSYLIEVDRATVALPTLRRKATAYVRYYRSGREQQRWGVFPQVVFVVPSERRKAAVVEALVHLPADGELFRVSLADDAIGLMLGGPA